MFDPKTNRFPYPEETDRHYLAVHQDRGIAFDEHYPYVDKSKGFRFRQWLIRVLLYTIVFPLCRVRMGLKIEGRKNLRLHRDELKNGALSVSNHVHMWDYIAVMSALKPRRPYMLVWAPNVNGESGTLVRLVGGIPIPEHSIAGTKAYLKAVRTLLAGGDWLHIYAEGSMWEYYAPIRPFKRGAAHIAIETGKPVLPLAFSYRKPGWIRRTLFHQIALLTLRIGEPLFADGALPLKQRETDLTIRCHDAVCRLAGIEPDKNIYPPVFDGNQRIDYYTDTYGIDRKEKRQ